MTYEFDIVFHSQGVTLAARLFRNVESLEIRQPGVIAMGSWLTVKEQMATTYARRLAEHGYTALVFDFSGFGESAGDPRSTEIPARKIADIASAVRMMRTLAFVDAERIGCVAVCASAQYTLRALADGAPIRSFASVAGWFHDPVSIDGLSVAPAVATPSLFVHSDGCAFPEHAKRVHAAVKGAKSLVWGAFNHIDFYDRPEAVDFAVDAVRDWFERTL